VAAVVKGIPGILFRINAAVANYSGIRCRWVLDRSDPPVSRCEAGYTVTVCEYSLALIL